MPEDGTIRPLQPADLDEVRALIERTIATCYAGYYCPSAQRWFLDHHSPECILRDSGTGTVIVLENDGRIGATGTLMGNEIGRVFVDPQSQRRGFGLRIMRRLETRAAELGIERVELYSSTPSREFYESMGYGCIDEGHIPMEDGGRLHWYRMAKELSTPPARRC